VCSLHWNNANPSRIWLLNSVGLKLVKGGPFVNQCSCQGNKFSYQIRREESLYRRKREIFILYLGTFESVDIIIICDPPYNIPRFAEHRKDFGNDRDKQLPDKYLLWCDKWLQECFRIIKPTGTVYIYGFS
jgi:hypothetical protein